MTEPRALDSAGHGSRKNQAPSWLALVRSGGSLDIGPVMDAVGVRVRS